MEFAKQFKAAYQVSAPLVAIRTFDAASTIAAVKKILGEVAKDTPMITWNAIEGLRPFNKTSQDAYTKMTDGAPVEATIPFPMAVSMAKNAPADVLIFFLNSHLQWSEPTAIQGIWNLRDTFKANGDMAILLCSPGAVLPSELVNDVLMIEEPLPTAEDLKKIVTDVFEFAGLADSLDDDTLGSSTDALIGLPAFPAEQAAAMCIDKPAKRLDVADLWERKRQIINQTPGLSVWQGTNKLADIGGLESVKKFSRAVMEGHDAPKTILFMDEIEKAFAGSGTDMSGVKTELTGSMLSWSQDMEMDGVIYIGIPGVSKSELAKSLGVEYGTPVINFDLAGMQSSLVGSSGANLRAAQKTVDAISGGRVLMIATCNGIGSLPPELRRRFNLGTFFFDAPTRDERNLIWAIYRKKYSIPETDKQPGDNGWTGAEIKECCKKAYRLRMSLLDAAKYIVPVTLSSAQKINELRQECSGRYLSASYEGVYRYDAPIEADAVAAITPTPTGRRMRYDA